MVNPVAPPAAILIPSPQQENDPPQGQDDRPPLITKDCLYLMKGCICFSAAFFSTLGFLIYCAIVPHDVINAFGYYVLVLLLIVIYYLLATCCCKPDDQPVQAPAPPVERPADERMELHMGVDVSPSEMSSSDGPSTPSQPVQAPASPPPDDRPADEEVEPNAEVGGTPPERSNSDGPSTSRDLPRADPYRADAPDADANSPLPDAEHEEVPAVVESCKVPSGTYCKPDDQPVQVPAPSVGRPAAEKELHMVVDVTPSGRSSSDGHSTSRDPSRADAHRADVPDDDANAHSPLPDAEHKKVPAVVESCKVPSGNVSPSL